MKSGFVSRTDKRPIITPCIFNLPFIAYRFNYMDIIFQKIHNAILVLVLLGYHTESSPQNLKTFTLEELIPLKPDFYPERLSVDWTSGRLFNYITT